MILAVPNILNNRPKHQYNLVEFKFYTLIMCLKELSSGRDHHVFINIIYVLKNIKIYIINIYYKYISASNVGK